MKPLVHALPHQSRPLRGAPASPRGKPSGLLRLRLGYHEAIGAYRETPLRLAKSRLAAVARLHGACGRTRQARWACQLSFALSSCTPFYEWLHLLNLSGALFSLPPLGVVLRAANQDSNDCRWQSYLCFVPRSGKGGDARNFGLLPINEQHPLSLALLDSSPIGEPRA